MGCAFCDYAGPSKIIHASADTFVIEPVNPVVSGHVLVVPREHVETFAERPAVTARVMEVAAMWVSRNYQHCNVIVNMGRHAGQTVPHLHVHVVPRSAYDGLKMPWSDQRREEKVD